MKLHRRGYWAGEEPTPWIQSRAIGCPEVAAIYPIDTIYSYSTMSHFFCEVKRSAYDEEA